MTAMMSLDDSGLGPGREARAAELLQAHQQNVYSRTDRMFAVLMVLQFLAGLLIAVFVSPTAWAGRIASVHVHVYAAIFLGATLASLPVALAIVAPGRTITRFVIAIAQMLWSALFIHLSGGRIETHFHVFGSLAFLSMYRDWRVLVPATIVVAADHAVRQLLWPESVFGVATPEAWRFLEHAAYVVFEDAFLIASCVYSSNEMRGIAERQAEVEALSVHEMTKKSQALDQALKELIHSQDALVRAEKLAAVGELAASVGHELRNPLAAVRNATTFIHKRVNAHAELASDAKLQRFFPLVDRELDACTRILSDLLDFARERPLATAPCPLRPLVQEAIDLLPPHEAEVVNDVPAELPVLDLDRDQFRQVLINLLQNAVEAVPKDGGRVVIRAAAHRDDARPFVIEVEDNGSGIPDDEKAKIFEPLYTTKAKGTGLGLAVVASLVKRHQGAIRVESRVGVGTTFAIELSRATLAKVA